MADRKLNVEITADTRDLERGATRAGGAIDRTGGKFSGFAEKAKSYAKVAGVAMAGLALKWVADGSKLASETNENQSKVMAVFGKSGVAIDKWSKTTAKSMGISRREALEAAGGFGNMFDQLGIAQPKAAGMSKNMIKLAADFASFNNADPSEVLESMGAVFRGEYDSLQKFVPTASAARIEQQALADTGKKSAKELTAQEKALATYTVVTQDAGKASGDFARTQDQSANQQRIAKASAEDLQATIGSKLIPVQVALFKLLNDQLLPAFTALADFVGRNAAVFGPLAAGIATIVVAVKAWTIAQAALNAVMSANPITLIIIGIVALGTALVVAYQKVSWFRTGVDTAMRFVKAAFSAVFEFVKRYWPLLLTILTGPIGAAVVLIIKHWDKVKAAAQVLVSVVSTVFRTMASVVATVIRTASSAWNGFTGMLRASIGIVTSIMSRIAAAFRGPLDTARSIVEGIKGVFRGLLDFLRGLPSQVARIVSDIVGKFKGPINTVIDGINGLGITIPKLTLGGGSFLGKKLPEYTIPGTGKRYDPIPHIPRLAAGGIVRGSRAGSLVVAGDNYTPEVVGPLSKLGGVGGTVNNYSITVEVAPGSDPVRVGREVVASIRAYERVNGATWRTVPA